MTSILNNRIVFIWCDSMGWFNRLLIGGVNWGQSARLQPKLEMCTCYMIAVISALEVSFCKWLPIQLVEVAKDILVTSTASLKLHNQYEYHRTCEWFFTIPKLQNVRCRSWILMWLKNTPPHSINDRLEGAHDPDFLQLSVLEVQRWSP